MYEGNSINYLEIDMPIDCIIESQKFFVCCGYQYLNNERGGCLYFLDKNNFKIIDSVATTGTLHAFFKENKIFVANSRDISIFEENNLLIKYPTHSINTYVFVDDYIYVADEKGCITVFDFNLTVIKTISITKEPVWIVKSSENYLYFGNEAGECFRYSIQSDSFCRIGKKRLGIIDIVIDSDSLFISSYDDNVEVFDRHTLELKKKSAKLGSLWKILKHGNFFICSAIYEGLKIFNSEFELIKQIPVKTICYAIHLSDNRIIWADFYNKKIMWIDLQLIFDNQAV